MYNKTLKEIYGTKTVRTASEEVLDVHSMIDVDEGKMIFDAIKNNEDVCKTLEIGCAYGLSSLYICEALRGRCNRAHTIIDPFQKTDWSGVGLKNLERENVDYFHHIEEKSEIALPELLKTKEGSYDLVFIDGWHTFDHTLVDCFYGTRLLKEGGFLIVDDVGMPAIRSVIDFLLNYPCYEFYDSVGGGRGKYYVQRLILKSLVSLIPKKIREKVIARSFLNRLDKNFESMVVLKKVSNDERPWNWHNENF